MTMHELVFLGKNLVVEYNKRYDTNKYDMEKDTFVPNSNLTVEQVLVKESSQSSNGILETVLEVVDDPWWQYRIIYNPSTDEKISTIIEMK